MDNSLKVLLESINAQIKALNERGYKLYDADNQGYFINEISYNKGMDELEFHCKEEEKKEVKI